MKVLGNARITKLGQAYEADSRPVRKIARDFEVSVFKVQSLAKQHGWKRPSSNNHGGKRKGAGRKSLPLIQPDESQKEVLSLTTRPNLKSNLPVSFMSLEGDACISKADFSSATSISEQVLGRWAKERFGPKPLSKGAYRWADVRDFLLSERCSRAFRNYEPPKLTALRLALLTEEIKLCERSANSIFQSTTSEGDDNVQGHFGVTRQPKQASFGG